MSVGTRTEGKALIGAAYRLNSHLFSFSFVQNQLGGTSSYEPKPDPMEEPRDDPCESVDSTVAVLRAGSRDHLEPARGRGHARAPARAAAAPWIPLWDVNGASRTGSGRRGHRCRCGSGRRCGRETCDAAVRSRRRGLSRRGPRCARVGSR